jgi:hypothetical protein
MQKITPFLWYSKEAEEAAAFYASVCSDAMKFVCFGYIEADKFDGMSASERNAFADGCFAYELLLLRRRTRVVASPSRRSRATGFGARSTARRSAPATR